MIKRRYIENTSAKVDASVNFVEYRFEQMACDKIRIHCESGAAKPAETRH